MDKLQSMMELQEHLNSNVFKKLNHLQHYNSIQYRNCSDTTGNEAENRRDWIDKFSSALQSEICEVREATTQNVKWWKDKTKDLDGVKEEIIDCFHFLMSMALASGMNADEVYTRYLEKNKANFTRQDWDVNKSTECGAV
jgi:dimeric dUTPase (all-alpha-NTP-PPase superfamily)